jgi:hypothetical protein
MFFTGEYDTGHIPKGAFIGVLDMAVILAGISSLLTISKS